MYLFSLVLFSFFGIHPGVELLDHRVALFLVFCETCMLCPTVPAPIYIPNNVVCSLSPQPIFVISVLFDDNHSSWCEVIFHCGFDLYLPND